MDAADVHTRTSASAPVLHCSASAPCSHATYIKLQRRTPVPTQGHMHGRSHTLAHTLSQAEGHSTSGRLCGSQSRPRNVKPRSPVLDVSGGDPGPMCTTKRWRKAGGGPDTGRNPRDQTRGACQHLGPRRGRARHSTGYVRGDPARGDPSGAAARRETRHTSCATQRTAPSRGHTPLCFSRFPRKRRSCNSASGSSPTTLPRRQEKVRAVAFLIVRGWKPRQACTATATHQNITSTKRWQSRCALSCADVGYLWSEQRVTTGLARMLRAAPSGTFTRR